LSGTGSNTREHRKVGLEAGAGENRLWELAAEKKKALPRENYNARDVGQNAKERHVEA